MGEKRNDINELQSYQGLLAKLRGDVGAPTDEPPPLSLPNRIGVAIDYQTDDAPDDNAPDGTLDGSPADDLGDQVGSDVGALVVRPTFSEPTPVAIVIGGHALAPDIDPMRRFLASCQSERTAETMREALERVANLFGVAAESVPWASLRRAHVQDIFVQLKRRYSARTVNVTLAAVRGVLRTAWEVGSISGDDFARAVAVKNLKVNKLPHGRGLSDDEIARINDYCRALGPDGRNWPESAYGAFLLAAFALLLGAGLRASEASKLALVAYDARSRHVRVLGKGNKERKAPLGDAEQAAIEQWIGVRAELEVESPALLVRVHRSGAVGLKPLNRAMLGGICTQIAGDVLEQRFSPHDLRRTFCTDFITDTNDVLTAQRLMGHASPETTARYDLRGAEADAAMRRRVTILGRRPKAGA